MATVVDVLARLRADSSNMVHGFNSAEHAASSLNTRSMALASTIGNLAAVGIERVASGMLSAAKSGLAAASDFQQADIAFTTMLGSATKADAFLSELKTFAAQTPFELPGLLSSSRQLLAMGFDAKQVLPMLTSIGDAVAGLGLGNEGLERITRALGQMKAKGKVSSEELMQLAESGVPALRILADSFGVTTAKMQEMIQKGAVPADQGIQAIVDGLENGTKTVKGFGGMMEAQSKTLSGVLSTFKDTARNALVDGIMPALQPLTDALTTLMPAVEALAKGFGSALGPALTEIATTAAPAIAEAFKTLGPALGEVIAGIAKLVSTGLGVFLSALAPIVSALAPVFNELAGVLSGALMDVFKAIEPYLPQIAGAFVQLVEALVPLIPIAAKLISVGLDAFLGALTPVVTALAPLVADLADAIGGVLKEALDAVAPTLPDLADAAVEIVKALMPLIPVFTEILTAITPTVGVFADLVVALTPVIKFVADLISWFVQLVTNSAAGQAVLGALVWAFKLMLSPIALVANAIKTIVGALVYVWDKLSWFRSAISNAWNIIKTITTTVWKAIGGVIRFFLDHWQEIFKVAWETIKTVVIGPVRSIFNFIKDVFGKIAPAIRGALAKVKDVVSRIWHAIADPIINLGKKAFQWGKDIILGLWHGMSSWIGSFTDKLSTFVEDKIAGTIKDKLGISSPSKVTYAIGVDTAQGLANGIASGGGKVASSAKGLADAAANGAKPAKKLADAAANGAKPAKKVASTAKAASTFTQVWKQGVADAGAKLAEFRRGMYAHDDKRAPNAAVWKKNTAAAADRYSAASGFMHEKHPYHAASQKIEYHFHGDLKVASPQDAARQAALAARLRTNPATRNAA